MKIEIEIPDDNIRDAIDIARVTYWADTLHPDARWNREAMELVVFERDTERAHFITTRQIQRAVAVMAKEFPRQFKELMTCSGDMYTGDILIQCAAFGEEKYA